MPSKTGHRFLPEFFEVEFSILILCDNDMDGKLIESSYCLVFSNLSYLLLTTENTYSFGRALLRNYRFFIWALLESVRNLKLWFIFKVPIFSKFFIWWKSRWKVVFFQTWVTRCWPLKTTVSVELSSTNTDSSFESKKATAVVDFFRWFSHNVCKSLTLKSVQHLNFRLIFLNTYIIF